MSTWCLIKDQANNFIQGLKDGKLDVAKLANMSSEARHAALESFVGKDNVTQVNSLFESKLLLKNQQKGMINWIKRTAGLNEAVKRDMLSKVEKMEKILNPEEGKQFYKDLATTKMGADVTVEQAKTVYDLSKIVEDAKSVIKENSPDRSPEKLKYGFALDNFQKYVGDLKIEAKKISFKEQPVKAGFNAVGQIPGITKSLLSTWDNSLYGRQGAKTLLNPRTTHIWVKDFLTSWKDIGRALQGKDAMSFVNADVYSRTNALNGKYKAGGYGLDVMSEEAYPTPLSEKIPLLGRLFKASEAAFNGGAKRLRADLADKWIAIADKQGIDTLNPKEAQGIGTLISSMTGRGNLGKGEIVAKEANLLLFSVKFLKSNFDTLTFHALDSKATSFTRIEAAKNMVGMISSLAMMYTVAKALDPNSVELERRNPNFGKIKIFGQWTDPTGGMASMVTLASRVTPSYHDGKLSFWSQSKKGVWSDLTAGKYGQDTALDVFENFFEGKLSPTLGVVRDVWTGQTYQGEKPTIGTELKNATTPISVQTFQQLMKDPNSSNILGSMILDGLGFSVNPSTQYPSKPKSSRSGGSRTSSTKRANN